jgi:hypothetical protein
MGDKEKRRLSSDGETPKPSTKSFKMVDVNGENGEKDFQSKMID